jgi:hypothetical protein
MKMDLNSQLRFLILTFNWEDEEYLNTHSRLTLHSIAAGNARAFVQFQVRDVMQRKVVTLDLVVTWINIFGALRNTRW